MMRVMKGKVVGTNTVLLEEPLPDGTSVSVVLRAPGDYDTAGLGLDQDTARELAAALKEADERALQQ